jgi:hypothetical protein
MTISKALGSLAILGLFLAAAATVGAAENSFPQHGSISTTPGLNWESAFVTGNGRMGAMLFGRPGDETFVANHCRLFLPLGNREIVPDLAKHVAKMRQIYRAKGPGAAMGFFLDKAKEQGYPGLIPTDPYHPGFFIKIHQDIDGPATDYVRTEDFQTGEVKVRWRDAHGPFQRRMFVSRRENVIVLSIKGPAPCKLEFPAVGQNLITSHQKTSAYWVGYHNVYVNGKGGYDAGVRIDVKGGKAEAAGNVVTIATADGVLLLMRIVPWKTPLPKDRSEASAYSPENPDFKKRSIVRSKPKLADTSVVAYRTAADAEGLLSGLEESMSVWPPADTEELFSSHVKVHKALFDRVSIDLGGGADRAKTTEELLDQAAREKRLPAALMEKMYDAGRYMFICSAGELLPNLQGIWTGSWTPAWSGDFTLDTNVQAAMASACSGNLADLMEGYFRTMESFYPEWRLNARRIYGCRGFFTNARASNTALELHWGGWDGVFWTAGCGWLGNFFTQYAEYSGDRDFLARRCLPLLKETAAFYQDFLSETDKNGHVVFIPSYNPETGCGIDATMDIAVTRDVLGNLIAFSRELGVESSNIPKWEALLAKLPPYPVNNGALTEFPMGGVAAGHRHHSQLYPCFQSFDPLFETDAVLRKAAQSTVRIKIAGSDEGGEQSSFGRIQCGVSAAYLGMPEEAYGRLKVMAVKRSMNPSLITSHEPGAGILNTDGNGGIPQIVATMLAFSRRDRLDLLPALPAAWPTGSIHGFSLRTGCTLDLAWADGQLTSAIFHAGRDTSFTVRYHGESAPIRLRKGETLRLNTELKEPKT